MESSWTIQLGLESSKDGHGGGYACLQAVFQEAQLVGVASFQELLCLQSSYQTLQYNRWVGMCLWSLIQLKHSRTILVDCDTSHQTQK